MNEPRRPDTDSARRLQLRRRAKRGLVAGYIHELSARHNGGDPQEKERPQEPADQAEGG